jgi:hypothetical protein
MTPLDGKLQILLNAIREADPAFAEQLERRKESEQSEGRAEDPRN